METEKKRNGILPIVKAGNACASLIFSTYKRFTEKAHDSGIRIKNWWLYIWVAIIATILGLIFNSSAVLEWFGHSPEKQVLRQPEPPALTQGLYDSGEVTLKKGNPDRLFGGHWEMVLMVTYPNNEHIYFDLFLDGQKAELNEVYMSGKKSKKLFPYRGKEYQIDLLAVDENTAKIRIRENPKN